MGKSYSWLHYLCVVVWLVIHLVCQWGQSAAAAGNSSSILCKQHEREALLKMKQILTTHNQSVQVGLWVGEDCCQWQGVGCDKVTGNIILLNIVIGVCTSYSCQQPSVFVYVDSNSIITILLGLKHLTHLKLYGLVFGGGEATSISFPKVIGTMTQLRYLNLSYSGFDGEIPPQIGNLTNLQVLDLSYNYLVGNVPPQIGNLTNLRVLDLSSNKLQGNIPPQIGNLTNLQVLDLSSNKLQGNIPPQIGNLINLQALGLSFNSLTGHIPSSLGNCTQLQILDLSRNKLSGQMPPWTSDQLSTLSILRLQENQLGEFNSRDDSTILWNLCNLTNLDILDLRNNSLSGTIPNCWEYSRSLKVINLSSNNLSGVIPCSLGNISRLEYLHLSDNRLGGHIPSCLSSLTQLRLLNLGGNELSGAIPKWFTSFSRLEVLRLPRNKFNGLIPEKLCNFSHLRVMDLSSNQLTGNIPPCFGNLVGMIFPVNTASDNDHLFSPDLVKDNSINETVAGIAREYSSVLNYLVTIDLSNNNLVGVIPKELTKLFGVVILNLANNSFTGTIPENIGYINGLETLDLSGNKLCGKIPASLGKIDFLNHLNLSFNNLSGPIPTSSQLQTLNDPSIYAGNPYLCGDPLPQCNEQPNHSDNQDDEEKTNKLLEMMWFYLDVMLGFATGFWSVVGTLLLNKRWRHALFRRVEDASNWLYVAIALKLKKMMMKQDNSSE